MVQQEGADKKDGARHATKRLVAQWRQDHPHLKCLGTEDSLRAHAPPIATLHAYDLRALLGVTEGEQASLFQQGQAAEPAGRVPSDERHDRAAGVSHRLRFGKKVPRNESHTDVRGHCIESGARSADKVQPCSGVTDFHVSPRNVDRLMRGGRARGKSDNETCNTRKNPGDHFAHPYGHGAQHLSVVFARRMRLAFLVDQTPQRCGALCQAVWAKLGSKRRRWERRRALV